VVYIYYDVTPIVIHQFIIVIYLIKLSMKIEYLFCT